MELKRLSGLYFVFDMGRKGGDKFAALEAAIEGGVDVVQIWSAKNFDGTDPGEILRAKEVVKRRIPFLINNNLDLAVSVQADGVHFDGYETEARTAKKMCGEECIVGYTIGNDLSKVKWAERVGADYISFCSMYPTQSATKCEIVPLRTVRRAREMTDLPIFASGGINLRNAADVMGAGADGIAVISSIQNAQDPRKAAREFKKILAPFVAE